MTPQARQHALERIREAAATTGAVWSESERLEAAAALGWLHAMPERQEALELKQGSKDGR
jgi:hypothetical protein